MKHYQSFSFTGDFSCHPHRTFLREGIRIYSAKISIREICVRAWLIAIFLSVLIGSTAVGQTQTFVDNFNRDTLTIGAPTTYSITVTSGDGGASIHTNSFLELTNDTSAAANGNGVVYVSGLTQDFLGAYNQTLHFNTCHIEWSFNFKFNRSTNPSGLAAGSYGTAIILAASNGVYSGAGAGNGYAIVYGNSGSPDPIRFVKFAGGISGTVTNIISSEISDIGSVNNYVSVRVRYEPHGDNWFLFIRDDGNSNWSDPSTGVTNQKSSTISDTTYTSIPLTHFGFYWAYATAANQTSQFDNFGVLLTSTGIPSIAVSTPSLSSFGTITTGDSSSSQNFTASGINLTGDIVITPPIGFEMRTGTNRFSANPIILPQTDGVVPDTSIDVRFRPGNTGSFSGYITCTSTGATTKNIAVNGVAVDSVGLELFLTRDPLQADSEHAILFPHSGMGGGTVYGIDDWTYHTPVFTFYVVPKGSQSIGASEFEINWDTAKTILTARNGNIFDFFAAQIISAGKIKIDAGASSNLNVSPSPGKYLVQLDCTIIQPGFSAITITGTDIRFFDSVAQRNIQVRTHPGMIKFYLGDFASQNNCTTTGDGKINFDDIVQFALAYFSESDGEPAGYKAKFDIGPTNSAGSYFSMPNPDGQIQFEDLAIFSMGYGKTATLQLPKEHRLPVIFATQTLLENTEGRISFPLTISGAVHEVRGLSVSLTYQSSLLEYIGCKKCGEMNHEYCFMAAKAKGNTVTLDAAIIGLEHDGLLKEGAFANIVFKRRNHSKDYNIKIQSAKARDSDNRDIPILISSKEIPAPDGPASFVLAQNYPNPFNPMTVIEYSVPLLTARDLVSNGVRDGQLPGGGVRYSVSLKVYDMLGREVATLVNEQQDAGYYRVVWNGMNSQQQPVSSGIYFYQMRAVDPSSTPDHSFINVKKMLLMK